MERENDAFKPLAINHETIDQNSRRIVTEALSSTPVSLDTLIDEVKLTPPLVHTIVLELELAGGIARHPGGGISLVYK